MSTYRELVIAAYRATGEYKVPNGGGNGPDHPPSAG
jgi:hypothetical protein